MNRSDVIPRAFREPGRLFCDGGQKGSRRGIGGEKAKWGRERRSRGYPSDQVEVMTTIFLDTARQRQGALFLGLERSNSPISAAKWVHSCNLTGLDITQKNEENERKRLPHNQNDKVLNIILKSSSQNSAE